MRVRGTNQTDTEHVRLGAYHTLEVEVNRAFSLQKVKFDGIDFERISQATNPAASADLAVLLITVRRGGPYCVLIAY